MISTHILDLQRGNPAARVSVTLEKHNGNEFESLKQSQTDEDGRIKFDIPAEAGVYRLSFQVAEYFKSQNLTPFFTEAPVTFEITDTSRNYHVPLLLNNYGYSTYRGS